jgi:hypothetical protein
VNIRRFLAGAALNHLSDVECYDFHIRTLSTNEHHPDTTHTGILRLKLPSAPHTRGHSLQVVGRLVVVHFVDRSGHIYVWDWTTGDLQLVRCLSVLLWNQLLKMHVEPTDWIRCKPRACVPVGLDADRTTIDFHLRIGKGTDGGTGRVFVESSD